jgi:hypothetical protein
MEKVYIFCDEFGTSTLKQNDVKNITKFVYSSVIIKESQLKKAYEVRDNISSGLLKGHKIKSSSKILQNEKLRITCVNYLYNNLNFVNHFLIVDKEKLEQDKGGLRFKEVFYKYFQNIFLSEIVNSYTDFQIFMHQTISKEYGEELKSYLSKQVNGNLFENYEFIDDEKEPLIQFADLLAGSYGRFFNEDYYSDGLEKITGNIKTNSTISFFPEEKKVDFKPIYSDKEIDHEIFEIVRIDAFDYVNKLEIDFYQNKILNLLLTYQKIAPFIYLQTFEIIQYLKNNYNKEISTELLRLIIRDLRFEGIIIVSSNSKSGYKLAVNKNDIFQYFSHYSKYILPMLKKVQIANDILTSKTVGEFSPLKELSELAELVNKLKFGH